MSEAVILRPLDALGTECRDKIACGNATITEAARLAVEVRLRIDRGEDFPGGFTAWWATYCADSPWGVTKLLTAGGWREAKKTGEVPDAETVAANVEALKADQRRDQGKSRQQANSLTSENSAIAPADLQDANWYAAVLLYFRRIPRGDYRRGDLLRSIAAEDSEYYFKCAAPQMSIDQLDNLLIWLDDYIRERRAPTPEVAPEPPTEETPSSAAVAGDVVFPRIEVAPPRTAPAPVVAEREAFRVETRKGLRRRLVSSPPAVSATAEDPRAAPDPLWEAFQGCTDHAATKRWVMHGYIRGELPPDGASALFVSLYKDGSEETRMGLRRRLVAGEPLL